MYRSLVSLFAGALFAGSVVAAGTPSFGALDENGDGVISAQEAERSQGLIDVWPVVDANQDGVVDESEFSAFETIEPEATEPKPQQ